MRQFAGLKVSENKLVSCSL